MKPFFLVCLTALSLALGQIASAQYYPPGQQYHPIAGANLSKMASEHSLEVYIGQTREQLIIYNRPDGIAFMYKGKAAEGGYRSGEWQQGSWRTTDALYCLKTGADELCGTVYVEKRGARPSQAWWQFNQQNKLALQKLHNGDAFGLSDPARFFDTQTPHPLNGQQVLMRGEAKPEARSPIKLRERLTVAEVLGYHPRTGGTIPAGFLLRMQGQVASQVRTFDQDHRALTFTPTPDCHSGHCADQVRFVRAEQLMQPHHFQGLLAQLVPDQPAPVVWRLAAAQLGWSAEQEAIVVPGLSEPMTFDTGQLTAQETEQAGAELAQAQAAQDEGLLRQLFVGRTVRLSSNLSPELHVFLAASGQGFVYRETIQTQPDPRRGTWRQSLWNFENGQLCLPALDDDCFAISTVGDRVYELTRQDGRNGLILPVAASVAGDVFGLQDATSFYAWGRDYARIGQSLLFRQAGTNLRRGSVIVEGEILGYLDRLETGSTSGFFVRTTDHRQIAVYETPDTELLLGFPRVLRCASAPCPDEIAYVTLDQEISDTQLDDILAEAKRWQAGGKKWRTFRNAAGALLLGGLAYNVLSPDDVAPVSHSAADDLTDMLIDRLQRYEEAVKAKADQAEAELRDAKRRFEEETAARDDAGAAGEGAATSATADPDTPLLEASGDDFFSDDPYRVLGVKAGASRKEIKDAWRELVKRWHPDVQVGDEAKTQAEEIIKRVNWAFEQLK